MAILVERRLCGVTLRRKVVSAREKSWWGYFVRSEQSATCRGPLGKKRVRLVPVSRRPAPTSAEEASLCSDIFLLLFQFQFIKTCCLQKLYYSSTRYARSQGEVAHQTNHSRSLVARECTAHCFQDCFLGSGANVPEEPTTVSEYVKKKSSPSNPCPDIVLYRQGALR